MDAITLWIRKTIEANPGAVLVLLPGVHTDQWHAEIRLYEPKHNKGQFELLGTGAGPSYTDAIVRLEKDVTPLTKLLKPVWSVAQKETGRFASFHNSRRAWPSAHYGKNGPLAAFTKCAEGYNPEKVRTGNHQPLHVAMIDYSTPNQQHRVTITPKATLQAAKDWVADMLAKCPGMKPGKEQGYE